MSDMDFFSDLSKDLYGTRRFADLAKGAYEDFVAAHPGETPCLFHDELVTEAEYERLTQPQLIPGVTLNGQPLFFDPVHCEVMV